MYLWKEALPLVNEQEQTHKSRCCQMSEISSEITDNSNALGSEQSFPPRERISKLWCLRAPMHLKYRITGAKAHTIDAYADSVSTIPKSPRTERQAKESYIKCLCADKLGRDRRKPIWRKFRRSRHASQQSRGVRRIMIIYEGC